MRLLDRYLLRELLLPFGFCLGGFFIFWISFDLFSDLADLRQRKLSSGEILHYYLIKTPELLMVVLPVALLLALLYALTNMARHHELTAIRAAGVSLWRISLPYLAVGTLCSLFLFAVNELWIPDALQKAEQVLDAHMGEARASEKVWERNLGFNNSRQRRNWLIERYNTDTGEMIRPRVQWTLATGTKFSISAERAIYTNNHWVFTDAHQYVFPNVSSAWVSVTETNLLVMEDFTETPEEIRSEIKISKISNFREARKVQLSIAEILRYQNLHAEKSLKSNLLETKLHGRLAAPLTCFVVVLLALPFGALSGRRNVFVGVASSIVIVFIYFILSQVALALGAGGYLPGWIAAWMPTVLFSSAGIAATWRAR